MSNDITLEILPNGYVKFRRGNRKHNEKMLEVISFLIEEDGATLEELQEFFKGSEDIELLHGESAFCG